jgi:hypothetical protein
VLYSPAGEDVSRAKESRICIDFSEKGDDRIKLSGIVVHPNTAMTTGDLLVLIQKLEEVMRRTCDISLEVGGKSLRLGFFPGSYHRAQPEQGLDLEISTLAFLENQVKFNGKAVAIRPDDGCFQTTVAKPQLKAPQDGAPPLRFLYITVTSKLKLHELLRLRAALDLGNFSQTYLIFRDKNMRAL